MLRTPAAVERELERLNEDGRRVLCRHLPKLSPDPKTTLALLAELYKLVEEVSIRQKKVAATLPAAALDAGFHFPASALRLLQKSADTLADSDPRCLAFPQRLRSYIASVCPLLISRLIKNADECEEAEPPSMPEPNMWFPEWLAEFDRAVETLAAAYLAEWRPPALTGRRPMRSGAAAEVVARRHDLRDKRLRLRKIEAESATGFKRTRGPRPWSDAQFCAIRRIDPSEFGKWLSGRLPDESATTKKIEEALTIEIRRMLRTGVREHGR